MEDLSDRTRQLKVRQLLALKEAKDTLDAYGEPNTVLQQGFIGKFVKTERCTSAKEGGSRIHITLVSLGASGKFKISV